MDDIPDNIRTAIPNLFTDPRWRKISDTFFLYFIVIDGVTVGIIIATKNPQSDDFLLNKREYERLRDAEASGKIGKAYVVDVILNGADKTCVGVASTAWVSGNKLAGRPTRFGKLGDFWTASSFTSEDEPF